MGTAVCGVLGFGPARAVLRVRRGAARPSGTSRLAGCAGGGQSLLPSPVKVSAGSGSCCGAGWVTPGRRQRCGASRWCAGHDVLGLGDRCGRGCWHAVCPVAAVTSPSQHEAPGQGPLGNVPVGVLCCAGHGPARLAVPFLGALMSQLHLQGQVSHVAWPLQLSPCCGCRVPVQGAQRQAGSRQGPAAPSAPIVRTVLGLPIPKPAPGTVQRVEEAKSSRSPCVPPQL